MGLLLFCALARGITAASIDWCPYPVHSVRYVHKRRWQVKGLYALEDCIRVYGPAILVAGFRIIFINYFIVCAYAHTRTHASRMYARRTKSPAHTHTQWHAYYVRTHCAYLPDEPNHLLTDNTQCMHTRVMRYAYNIIIFMRLYIARTYIRIRSTRTHEYDIRALGD